MHKRPKYKIRHLAPDDPRLIGTDNAEAIAKMILIAAGPKRWMAALDALTSAMIRWPNQRHIFIRAFIYRFPDVDISFLGWPAKKRKV